MRVAIYCRVSTKKKEQNTDTQLFPLREHVQHRQGWTVAGEYIDRGVSGAKDRRPQLDALMAAARARTIDAVLVFKLDRFGRSLRHLVNAISEFQDLGVEFISLRDSLDTTTAAGKLQFHMMAAFAEFERALISERVRAGMERARRQGVRFGSRPRLIFDREKVRAMRAAGTTVREI